ncbi:hypothetical protein BRADI_1g38105v3 [Brachypodium distachyon]|nr:hypothetical protein BRADI_1g38105v3 [Brachypodium distachyon]
MYIKWAAGIQFYVEDSIEFMYKNDSVAKVDKYAYYHCNSTAPAGTSPAKDGSSLFLLDTPGYAYFASADAKHCKKGQRLMLNVKARQAPAPALAPETEEIPTPPAPAPLPSSPAPAPRRPVMENGAAALASTSSRALVFLAALALMGLIRA